MCALFRKTTALERRRRRLEKELALVKDDIRALSRAAHDPGKADKVRLKHRDSKAPSAEQSGSPSKNSNKHSKSAPQEHEERFTEYLSGNFQTVGSLKNERRLQRNKAVVMMFVVFIVLLWLWRHFF